MSRNELKLQAEICKSVVVQGGWAKKLTNQFTIGIPDLLISLPGLAPCLAEVKDFDVVGDKFDRKLDVSPKQRHELLTFNAVNPATAVILVGLKWGNEHHLVCLPADAERLSDAYRGAAWGYTKRLPGLRYDMKEILKWQVKEIGQ